MVLGCGLQGLGFRIWDLNLRVEILRVKALKGLGLRCWALGTRKFWVDA